MLKGCGHVFLRLNAAKVNGRSSLPDQDPRTLPPEEPPNAPARPDAANCKAIPLRHAAANGTGRKALQPSLMASWVGLVESSKHTTRGLMNIPRHAESASNVAGSPGTCNCEGSLLKLTLLQQRNLKIKTASEQKPLQHLLHLVLGAAHQNEVHVLGRRLVVLSRLNPIATLLPAAFEATTKTSD